MGKKYLVLVYHTLILGWNEATARVVAQTSFLRKQYTQQNEKKYPILKWFPILKTAFDSFGLLEIPSSTMVKSDIVILSRRSIEEVNSILEKGKN